MLVMNIFDYSVDYFKKSEYFFLIKSTNQLNKNLKI